jgi:hypothetical protein
MEVRITNYVTNSVVRTPAPNFGGLKRPSVFPLTSFLKPSKLMLLYDTKLGRDRFLSHPFPFIIHKLFYNFDVTKPKYLKRVVKQINNQSPNPLYEVSFKMLMLLLRNSSNLFYRTRWFIGMFILSLHVTVGLL